MLIDTNTTPHLHPPRQCIFIRIFMCNKMTFSALKSTFRIVKVILSLLKVTFSRLKVTFSGARVTNTKLLIYLRNEFS